MTGSRIDDLLSAIGKSRGGVAILWNYSASLSELSIRVTWAGTSENLHIVCNGCTRIEAPSTWNNVDFQLIEPESGAIKLMDEKAKFSVTCRKVRAFCNVAPMFAAY